MMRFKSERRLGKTAPAEENKARIPIPKSQAQESSESLAIPEIVAEEEPLLLLPADNVAVHIPTISDKNEIPASDQPLGMEAKLDNEPFPEVNELLITDPLAEDKLMFSKDPDEPSPEANELIITDPLAEDKLMFSQDPDKPSPEAKELIITDFIGEAEPVFSPAHNEPPVILIDSGKVENVPIQTEPQAEEMAIVEESPNEFVNTRITFDFKSNPAMAFDAEPALTPAPKAESVAMQINDEDKKLPVESAAANSAVVNQFSAEAWDKTSVSKLDEITSEPKVESAINEMEKTSAAESFTEMADEKSQPMNEPYKDFLKKTKSPKKIAFNFKYILVLILLAIQIQCNFDEMIANSYGSGSSRIHARLLMTALESKN